MKLTDSNIEHTKKKVLNKFSKTIAEFQEKHLTVPGLIG